MSTRSGSVPRDQTGAEALKTYQLEKLREERMDGLKKTDKFGKMAAERDFKAKVKVTPEANGKTEILEVVNKSREVYKKN